MEWPDIKPDSDGPGINGRRISLAYFCAMNDILVKDLAFSLFLSKNQIQQRISAIATALSKQLKGKKPVFLGILNGSFLFAADLFRQITVDAEISFVKLASYSGTTSSGKVLTLLGLDVELYDRTVVIVEDIVDSGLTMSSFLPKLAEKGPKEVLIVSLLVKPDALQHKIDIDYIGFEIPATFVVGYGLDYEGFGRNHDAIYQLKDGTTSQPL